MLDTRPLRAATFRHLAAAYWTNELGNLVGEIALAILVFDRTRSAIATATLFLTLRFAPAVLAQLLTSRIEVVPTHRVLPVLYVIEAAVFAALAITSSHFSLLAILILSAADGILAITAKALTRSAGANHLLNVGMLREGNAILNLGAMTTVAVGPALGGILAGSVGVEVALFADCATFLISAAVVVTTPGLHVASDQEASTSGRLRAAVAVIRGHAPTRRLFVAFALALMFASVVIPIEIVFAKRTLHAGDLGYGLLVSAWGVGMVVGGALFAMVSRQRTSRVLALSAAAIAFAYGGMALSPALAIACGFAALGGIGNGVAGIAAITAIQEAVPAHTQSVVMALLEGLNQVMPAIGFIIGGAVTALASPRTAYAVAAAGVAAIVVAAAVRALGAVNSSSVPLGDH